jgi:hypothetical protein
LATDCVAALELYTLLTSETMPGPVKLAARRVIVAQAG